MHVHTFNPMLRAPETTKHVKPQSDELVSSFAFIFNLRQYTTVLHLGTREKRHVTMCGAALKRAATLVDESAKGDILSEREPGGGALHSSTFLSHFVLDICHRNAAHLLLFCFFVHRAPRRSHGEH